MFKSSYDNSGASPVISSHIFNIQSGINSSANLVMEEDRKSSYDGVQSRPRTAKNSSAEYRRVAYKESQQRGKR